MSKYCSKPEKIYPQNTTGYFRKIKWLSSAIFLAIFFLCPYLRYFRTQDLPNQAILIDIPNSRAFFFFIEIWPQEVYYIASLLIISAIALFLITALWGRVWCGYSCPQTVWTDIFIAIERLFQGDRNQRILLDRRPFFNPKKLTKKTLTHISWLIFSFITGIGFVSYFTNAPTLINNLINFNISYIQAGWISGIAISTYVMAGFARANVCNHMCPYSRFQSAMFDEETLIISYNEKRGEPRGSLKTENTGHCINCNQCVTVCPQGIDIRDGLQMECIACGLCIDACNNIMEKVNLPKDLIAYDTLSNLNKPVKKLKLLRPRTIYYAATLAVAISITTATLVNKSTTNFTALPNYTPRYVLMSNGNISNSFYLKITNKTYQDQTYRLKIDGLKNYNLKFANPHYQKDNIKIKANKVQEIKIYLQTSKQNLSTQQTPINLTIIDEKNQEYQNKAIFSNAH